MVKRGGDLEREVIGEIERVAGRRVSPGDHLIADLGLDSLGLTALAVELEDRFLVRLDEVDGARPHTVADVIALIARRRAEGA